MNFTLKKSRLADLLQSMGKTHRVILPVENDTGASCFEEFSGQEPFLAKQTTFSPKHFFFEPREKIFSFRKRKNSYSVKEILHKKKRVLFGLRPCDANALLVLDRLFLEFYGEDAFYAAKRKNTLTVVLQCKQACSDKAFCTSLGTGTVGSYDLLLVERGNDFWVGVGSEAGQQLVSSNKAFFSVTRDQMPDADFKCKNELNANDVEDRLELAFESRVYEKEAERCLSCTACTQVCPTCYCFLIDDKFDLENKAWRLRCLDSCHLKRFSKIAGNRVFRESRKARLRQFVMHKLSYYKQEFGVQLCVGCGRCIQECPVGIDITRIVKSILGDR